MAFVLNPDRSLRELLSAAAVDPALRRRLKASAQAVLSDWGIRTPGRTVYFVEPGQVPAEGRPGEAFVELPHLAASLADDDLDLVAGGWEGAREAVDRAVRTVYDPWMY